MADIDQEYYVDLVQTSSSSASSQESDASSEIWDKRDREVVAAAQAALRSRIDREAKALREALRRADDDSDSSTSTDESGSSDSSDEDQDAKVMGNSVPIGAVNFATGMVTPALQEGGGDGATHSEESCSSSSAASSESDDSSSSEEDNEYTKSAQKKKDYDGELLTSLGFTVQPSPPKTNSAPKRQVNTTGRRGRVSTQRRK